MLRADFKQCWATVKAQYYLRHTTINLKFPREFIIETFSVVFLTSNILPSSFIFEGNLERKLKVITKAKGKAQNKKRRSQKNNFAIGLNLHNVKAVI